MSSLVLPIIDSSLCTLCGQCATVCPGHAVEMTPTGPTFVRPSGCTYCAECEAVCPEHAIRCEFSIVYSPPNGQSEEPNVR